MAQNDAANLEPGQRSTGRAAADERLNEPIFTSYRNAQRIIEDWRNGYNQNRPHTSLNGLTPNEFANRSNLDQT